MVFGVSWTAARLFGIGPSLAGPLDMPDPDEMGRYACAQGPVGSPSIGDRKKIDAAPGQPLLPEDLAGALVPVATDDALKRAGKGKLEAWPAVATLAVGGGTITADCEGPPTDRDDFSFGCKRPLQCELMTRIDGRAVRLATRPQAGQQLAPIESEREALGLLAIVEQDLFLPLTEGERAVWTAEAPSYTAVEPVLPWLGIETHDQGWLVRAPKRARCGCEHDIVRYAWWVSRTGRVCLVEETPVILAFGPTTCG